MHDFVIYTTDYMPQEDDITAPSADAPTSTICTRYNGVAPPRLLPSIQCDTRMTGRYVVIQIPGPSETLTLCEVEIYGRSTRTFFCYLSARIMPYILCNLLLSIFYTSLFFTNLFFSFVYSM